MLTLAQGDRDGSRETTVVRADGARSRVEKSGQLLEVLQEESW